MGDTAHTYSRTNRPKLSEFGPSKPRGFAGQAGPCVRACDQGGHKRTHVASNIDLCVAVSHELRAAHTRINCALRTDVHALNTPERCVLDRSSRVTGADEVHTTQCLIVHPRSKAVYATPRCDAEISSFELQPA